MTTQCSVLPNLMNDHLVYEPESYRATRVFLHFHRVLYSFLGVRRIEAVVS